MVPWLCLVIGKNLKQTNEAIRDGWLFTGDVGKMDENGWFYVVDRKEGHDYRFGF